MSQQVLSVWQVNEYIRAMMDNDSLLLGVAVRGEISNYKVYPSGHHYFTLKDETSALRCVMFRQNAVRLRFRPANGMKVIAMGRIAAYTRDGTYQLNCSTIMPDGVGDLHAAFEQLKKDLAQKGLFDPAHKQKLPQYPGVIGVVTSSAGAAVHDILRILRRRYPLIKVRLFPVRVQGAEAPGEIASAIQYANHYALADVLIVGRGGGSIEDLWPFNDERVAQAIYGSKIPVISAVGHEPDITIADYVADVRAATPSNAAELAVPDQDALRQNLDVISTAMSTALQRQLRTARKHLQMLAARPVLQSPTAHIDKQRKDLMLLKMRLQSAQTRLINGYNQKFLTHTAKLDALSPLKVLARGYAVVRTQGGEVVASSHTVSVGDRIQILVSDGCIAATVDETKEIDS